MTPFRDLSIRRKVAFTVLLTGTIVLVLNSAAFMAYEWMTFRKTSLLHLQTLSRVIAANSTAALLVKNDVDAQGTLATLRTEPDIVSAAIHDDLGRRVASYAVAQPAPEIPSTSPPGGYVFTGNQLVVYEPIMHDGRGLGTLMIQASLAATQQRLLLYGAMVLGILAMSSLAAFALSARLQRGITEPIRELAESARTVTLQGDYSHRATRYGNDELGALTDAFNRMLDEITEREHRLSASEERLLVALGAAEMGTWRYYPDRRESIVDEHFRRIYGLPAGESPATVEEMMNRIFPEDRELASGALDRALNGTDPHFSFEYRVLAADGTVRWVRDRGRVVRRSDGGIDYVTGALVDITDRKKAEEEIRRLNTDLEQRVVQRTAELERANRELEAFTYSVSHDLRGPLRHMTGYAEIIHDDPASTLSEESRACLGRIVSAATRLSRLVDSLLNLGRVGRRPLVLQRTRLDDLVTAAIRELESETRNRNVEWQRLRLPTVDCDPGLMHIVFVNLISNALKYSRPRDPAVIHVGMEIANGETIVFVRDNGVGFDPRFEHKLFGVFERLHGASAFEGTGIGLATVDRIIRKHGGRIWAKSAVNAGATFYFTVPGL